MHASPSESTDSVESSREARIGRRVGIIIYWVLVVYVVVVAFVSLIPQVFGSPVSHPVSCCAHDRG